MEEIAVLLAIMAVCFTIAGPIALVMAITALKKNRQTADRIERLENLERLDASKNEQAKKPTFVAPPPVTTEPVAKPRPKAPPVPIEKVVEKPKVLMEQKIGTQWILIAGIITVLVGVGLLLKFAYENFYFPPVARVIAVAVAGLLALVIGEITRRRGYEIVAKGVTALGFALLYASVFAAYQIHSLIEMVPALLVAVAVTAGAMAYAVILNEAIIAFLSLLGGFATPLIALGEFDNPMTLFVYVTILSIGAMAAAMFRKWRSISIVTFFCTFGLYTMWFFNYYYPNIGDEIFTVEMMPTAIGWLSWFFVIYLLMPVVHELIKKTKSNVEDVSLILFNAILTFIFLCLILESSPRKALPLAAVIIAIAHFLFAAVVTMRNRSDTSLRVVLTGIAIFFITVAIPLYCRRFYLPIAWIAESLILAIIGLRYRSNKTRFVSIVPLLLSFGYIISELPLHTQGFQLIFNPQFGLWVLQAFALLVYHLIFRLTGALDQTTKILISRLTFVLFGLVLFFAITAELFANCEFNIQSDPDARRYFSIGMVVLAIAEMLFFTVKPISPSGKLCRAITVIAGLIGTGFSFVSLSRYRSSFMIFLNPNFVAAFSLVAALLILAWIMKYYAKDCDPKSTAAQMPAAFVIWAAVLLLILITEQIWYFFDYSSTGIAGKAGLVAQMWISIAWAIYGTVLMIIGFCFRSRPLRYIALALFAILLGKVFLVDTRQIQSGYRIVAFLATGVTMVGISYLYQFLKKKGFFDKLMVEKI